jgi:WD40 repeat protein
MKSFPHPVVGIGLEMDWPSSITIQTHVVSVYRLSPSENLLALGGQREGSAVYSLWDIKTEHGETFIHPCKTRSCFVYHVSFGREDNHLILRTGCGCGKLCRWDISSDKPSLLDEIRLGLIGSCLWWADDGSKAVSGRKEFGMICGPYQLFISGTQPIQYSLGDEIRHGKWRFSPGSADKILGIDHHLLVIWECASGVESLRKTHQDLQDAYISPDGTLVVCINTSGVVELISTKGGIVLRTWKQINQVRGCQFFSKEDEFIVWNDHLSIHFMKRPDMRER